jgi:hypothetical protein
MAKAKRKKAGRSTKKAVHRSEGAPTANMLIRDMPVDLWKALKVRAATETVPLKVLVVRLLQRATR